METFSEQFFINAYALLLSGAGKMNDGKEIWVDKNSTVEFLNFPSFKNAIIRKYDETGKRREYYYKNLKLYGRITWYEGEKEEIVLKYKNGYQYMKITSFFTDGTVSIMPYKNEEPHGKFKQYYSNGKISQIRNYKNGKMKSIWDYDEDGNRS